jgi:hypothetical protein
MMKDFDHRARILALAMVGFIALFAVLRGWKGLSFLPNFEWVLPTVMVLGSLSRPKFGILAVLMAQALWILLYGPRPIQLFTCSGFALVWILALRRRSSPFASFGKLLGGSLLTCAAGILLYDFWTGVVGWSLLGHAGLYASLLGQIPFTLYHLCSLFFVPPLVALAKLTLRIKIPAPVVVPTRIQTKVVR